MASGAARPTIITAMVGLSRVQPRRPSERVKAALQFCLDRAADSAVKHSP